MQHLHSKIRIKSGFVSIALLILGAVALVGIGFWADKSLSSKSLGSNVIQTQLSDTINTFRTNVNSSLVSLQSDIANVTSTQSSYGTIVTQNSPLPQAAGGTGTSTLPATNTAYLGSNAGVATWKNIVGGAGITVSSTVTSTIFNTLGFDNTVNINFTGADTFSSSTIFNATSTFNSSTIFNGHVTATDFTSSSIASLAFGQSSSTSATTTVSTSFVDLTPSAITMTTGAHRVLLVYTSMFQNSTVPNFASVDFTVDGNRIGPTNGLSIIYETVNSNLSLNATAFSPLLSAGSHTFKVQVKTDTGTMQTNQFQFTAKEQY